MPPAMRPLSVALLTWEYPPVVVGGLSRHVQHLSEALTRCGHDVTVFTRGLALSRGDEREGGVRVVRVTPDEGPSYTDLVPWVLELNRSLLDRAWSEVRTLRPDVIHAHDWLVAHAAVALADRTHTPLVATIHATEHGRHRGRLAGPTQRFVHGVERWLTSTADRVIACSAYMRREVIEVLETPSDRVDAIPNQIELAEFEPVGSRGRVRDGLGIDGSPLVVFAGRLEYEKGVQTILEALPLVDRRIPGVRLVVAGTGTYRPELEARCRSLRLGERVRFEGFVEEDRLRDLYGAADLVVVPSLYEPFGLVALETMASGTPVVAADTGGLREVVEEGVTGLRFPPGDPQELSRAMVRVLGDGSLARTLAERARGSLAVRGSWTGAASRTAEVYRRAIGDRNPAR